MASSTTKTTPSPYPVFASRALFIKDLVVSIVELKDGHDRGIERQLIEALAPETALERNVVHAHGDLGASKLPSGLVDLFDQHRHHGGVPVVGHHNAVLPRGEGQAAQRLNSSARKERKTLLVVCKVSAGLVAIQLRAGHAPDLGQEGWVVNPYTVNALFVGVEKAHGLAVDIDDDAGIPGIAVLVVPRKRCAVEMHFFVSR